MSDRELLDALTVIARRFGAIPEGKRLALVADEEIPEADKCLAAQPIEQAGRGGVRLLCSHPVHGTETLHSWERAFVGIAACTAYLPLSPRGTGSVHCELRAVHTGHHRAAAVTDDGAPSELRWVGTDSAARVRPATNWAGPCLATEWGTNGHRAQCHLTHGHEGDHSGRDADGSRLAWPSQPHLSQTRA